MKQYMGKRITVQMDGMEGPVSGIVCGDRKDMFLLRSENGGKTYRFIKSHVVMFVPDEEPEPFQSVQVLYCEHAKCPGVRLAIAKTGVARADFELFMSQCPARTPECRCGSRGDITDLTRTDLIQMVDKTIFGEFPEKGAI